MNLSPVKKAVIALIITNLIWGAAAPIFKAGLASVPPYTFAFWRFFISTLILGLLLGKRVANPAKNWHDVKLLVAYALTGTTINISFFLVGLTLTQAVYAPVIASAQPILVLFLSIIFLREQFVLRKFIGMTAGAVGIVIIIIEPLLVADGGSVIGNILLVLATLGAVGQTITGKVIMKKFDPFTVTFWAFLIGAASFLPLAIREYTLNPTLYQTITGTGFASVMYGAVFSSFFAYCLFAYGVSKIKASSVAVFTYIDPVIGTILSWFILKEPITSYFILGAIFIFTGIFIAEGRIHYHPFRRLWGKDEAD
jgi:drug/metabolite transporter (DMT)-like permease